MNQKTIAFIEDEPTLHKTLGELLKEKGYQLLSAFDGEEGLKLVKEKQPDLIILDLILPKIHGFELLKELKKDKETKDIPVIVLTNLESPNNIQEALSLGVKAYLLKLNYSLEELAQKIEELIEKLS